MARPTHLKRKTRKKAPGKPTPPKNNRPVRKNKMNQADNQAATWDDLLEIQQKSVELINCFSHVIPFLKDPEITKHLDMERMNLDLRLARKDIDEFFTPKLVELSELHKDRKGIVADMDEHMALINCFVEYQVLIERMDSTLTPTYLSLAESIDRANNLRIAEAEAADVSVVTDVEFKEDDNG